MRENLNEKTGLEIEPNVSWSKKVNGETKFFHTYLNKEQLEIYWNAVENEKKRVRFLGEDEEIQKIVKAVKKYFEASTVSFYPLTMVVCQNSTEVPNPFSDKAA
jgi:hypothetical protein